MRAHPVCHCYLKGSALPADPKKTNKKTKSFNLQKHRRLGVLVQPGNRSVRSCVRACERSCVCPRDDVVPVAGRFLGKSPPGRRRVPFPVVGLAVPSRRFPSLLSGFSLLSVASRCFPWLPVASRCFPCAFPLRISAYLCVWTPARISPCRFGAPARISPCHFGPAGRFSFSDNIKSINSN